MATPRGCLDLLSMLALADNRRFDEGVAIGWAEFLRDVPDSVILKAGEDAVRSHEGYIRPETIVRYAKPYMAKIARDVRSARARGLVDRAWPDTQPIPVAAQESLRAEFEATNDPDQDALLASSSRRAVEA